MLSVDIPTAADLRELAAFRADVCASIYLPTTPVTAHVAADRIEFKDLSKSVVSQLSAAGADKHRVAALAEHFDDLVDDDEFWRRQARSLAVLATPERVRTFRLPNALQPLAAVADRFHLKPLLRTVAFPNACYLLALAENSVRLVEVSAGLAPITVKLDAMPKDAAAATHRATVNDRSPSGRLQGSEGQKVLLRQFARSVDHALRSLLSGSNVPLVLASAEPLTSIYRSVNTYAHLARETIEGSPAHLSDEQLAERARPILDALYRDEIAAWKALFETRRDVARATTDVAQTARAAAFGAVESLLVDIDAYVPGELADDGTVTFAQDTGAHNYGLVDAIAARVLLSDGRVIGVRKDDVPGGNALAALLRYPV